MSRRFILLFAFCIATTACRNVVEPDQAEILLAVGDIAGCDTDGDEQVAALLDTIPGVIATLGDNVYLTGTAENFANCFHPSWGRHRERLRPSIGNHDWDEHGTFDGYFDYFGAAAGPRPRGYYGYDVGNWRVIALNSELATDAQSPQVAWLKQELQSHSRPCTLAYWHRPRFTSGDHPSDVRMQPLWEELYAANADLVMNGHEHDYERFAPQTPSGQSDVARGIRQFVAGTGGFQVELALPDNRLPNSEFRDGAHLGVLRLTLRRDSYRWEFVTTMNTVIDAG